MTADPAWIDATEQLPDKFGMYLVFAASCDPEKPLCVTSLFDPDDEIGWISLVEHWGRAITHWMPLPPPPVDPFFDVLCDRMGRG